MLIEVERTSIQSDEVPHSSVSSRQIIGDTPEGPDGPDNSGNRRLRTVLEVLGKSSLFSEISFKTLLRAIGQVPNSDLSAAEIQIDSFPLLSILPCPRPEVDCNSNPCYLRDSVWNCAATRTLRGGILLFLRSSEARSGQRVRPVHDQLHGSGDTTSTDWSSAWAYQAASKRLGIVDLFACQRSPPCAASGPSSISGTAM